MTISLRGETGAKPLVTIEMTMEEFGNAISGLGYVHCEYLRAGELPPSEPGSWRKASGILTNEPVPPAPEVQP